MTGEKSVPWYQLSSEKVSMHLKTSLETGLTPPDIAKRQKRDGRNKFAKQDGITTLGRIWKEIKNPLVMVLLFAGIATIVLHEVADTIVIFIALFINVAVGVLQENRASNAFQKLVQSQEKQAMVIRDGKQRIIPAEELVVGDIVELSAGMYVPADMRIISEVELVLNESALTGEWVEVAKDAEAIPKQELPITDQVNMAWMGTLVTGGSGKGVVVATGNKTQIGAIARDLASTEDGITPLQKSIDRLARFIVKIILAIIVIIVMVGIYHGYPISELVLIAIAISVAAMPQGLPAAVTVVLALGMENILKRKGLVRNLLAAETLGSTTTILTDKTGTLTKAEMHVAHVVTLSSANENHVPDATQKASLHTYDDDQDALKMAIYASDAFVEGEDQPLGEWIVRGRPVEQAIILAGAEAGFSQQKMLEVYPRIDFLAFESGRRFAASLHRIDKKGKRRLFVSGAPELLIEQAEFIYKNGKAKKISAADRALLQKRFEEESAQGMRVIASAYKDISTDGIPLTVLPNGVKGTSLNRLVFGGLVVMHDPLRSDVPQAIRTAREAGARIIMVTGDNFATALRVAQEAGIAPQKETVITGAMIEDMNDQKLLEALRTHTVFARVLPHQKLRLTYVLKEAGEVVAMTGDGINDAQALRNANIGLALGSGTEVAKESSDIILLENSFGVIVDAIEEGRRILDNLKKVVAYLLSTSFSEIILVGTALLAGTPIPLLPSQILWTNIIEEGFMNFSFAFEPKEKGVMERKPQEMMAKDILTPDLKRLIFMIAATTGVLLVGLYFFLLYIGTPEEELRTIMFVGVSIDSIFFAFSIKNLHLPIWKINLASNTYLLFALSSSFIMLIAVLAIPGLRTLLSLATPTPGIFLSLVGLGIINLVIIEAAKYFAFRNKNTSPNTKTA